MAEGDPPEPDPPELIFSKSCPYCRNIARAIRAADIRGRFRFTPIESDRGRELVEDEHGRFIHSPHLFTDDTVYYGISPTAKGVAKEMFKEYVSSTPQNFK